ncbi:hypothetical protein ACPCG0_10615 [Propionibacteriaceae bacterium Y1923]
MVPPLRPVDWVLVPGLVAKRVVCTVVLLVLALLGAVIVTSGWRGVPLGLMPDDPEGGFNALWQFAGEIAPAV